MIPRYRPESTLLVYTICHGLREYLRLPVFNRRSQQHDLDLEHLHEKCADSNSKHDITIRESMQIGRRVTAETRQETLRKPQTCTINQIFAAQ